MSANNNATRATIAEIQGKLFEIPTYQRLYEWESAQIEELLNDIKKACDESKNYFIGNITTSIKSEKEPNKFVLIDGQQRLTTLWFIGFYLASQNCPNWKEFIVKGENLRIAMPIRDSEEKGLKELANNINGKKDLAQSLQNCNVAEKIIKAFDYIEKWFNANLKKDGDNKVTIDSAKLNDFADFIYNQVCFVFVTLAQNTDLNRFFVRMNNRGKQLEKHEILKARILDKIKDDSSWQQYAKIWDLCSDMDKYIFQSKSDRDILNPKSQNTNSAESNNNDNLVKLIDIAENYKIPKDDKNKDKDSPNKVESIIDFPTFLLHCYKLWVAKKCKDKIDKISITKDKLLEIMWDNQIVKDKNKVSIIDDNFIFDSKSNAKQNCEEFIIDMLRYRVLFDYFVIKNNQHLRDKSKNPYAIKRLDKDSKGYYSVTESNALEKLTMIQNYLRVARQGEKQNYHHWLTPFLKFLSENKFLDCKSKENSNNQNIQKKKKIGFFQSKAENLVENLKTDSDDKEKETKCVKFLENLDTTLANKSNSEQSRELIKTANTILSQITSDDKNVEWVFIDKDKNWDFLKYGNEIRYWFYRLEYYLWKWGSQNDKIGNSKIKDIFAEFSNLEFPKGDKFKFEKILNAFYFRNLNSIEHIEPQSNFRTEHKWTKENIDCFGNLALISPAFNSQLSNQSNRHKALDLRKKIDDGNAESLKLWLVYALYIKESDKWTCGNAKRHLVQMLKILKESLGLNPNDSQVSQVSQDSKKSQGK